MPYEEDKLITCPHGNEDCDEDDCEMMCNECMSDGAEAHADAMRDTYD